MSKELIEEAKKAHKRLKEIQGQLLQWCQDPSNPLDVRWDTWVHVIDKKSHSYIGTNSKILDDLLNRWVDSMDISRHQRIDYGWFMGDLTDNWVSEEDIKPYLVIVEKYKSEIRDKKIDSLIDDKDGIIDTVMIPRNKEELKIFLKEEILKANFGSCEYDW